MRLVLYVYKSKLTKAKAQSDLTSKLALLGVGDWTRYAPEVPSNPNYSIILTCFSVVMSKKFLQEKYHYFTCLLQ